MESALEQSLLYVEKLQSLSANKDVAAEPTDVAVYKASHNEVDKEDKEDKDWSMLVDDNNNTINDDDFDFFDESPKTATTQQTPITPFTPATPTVHYSFIDHSLDEYRLQPTNGIIPNGYQQLSFNRSIRLLNYSNDGKYAVEEGMHPTAGYPPLWYQNLSRPHLEKRRVDKEGKEDKDDKKGMKDSRRSFIKRRTPSPPSSDEELDDGPVVHSSDDEFEIEASQTLAPTPITLQSNGSRGSDMQLDSDTKGLSMETRLTLSQSRWTPLIFNSGSEYMSGGTSAKELIPPKLAVGYDDQVMHTAPIGIGYWEKAGFGAFGGRKDIAVVLSCAADADRRVVHECTKVLCDMYTLCNLGRTQVLDGDAFASEQVHDGHHVVKLQMTKTVEPSTHLLHANQAALANEVYLALDQANLNEVLKSRNNARALAFRIYEKILLPVQKHSSRSVSDDTNDITTNSITTTHNTTSMFEFPAFTIARNVIPREQISIGDDKASGFNNGRMLHIAYQRHEDDVLLTAVDEYAHFSDARVVSMRDQSLKQVVEGYIEVFRLQSSVNWSVRVVTSSEASPEDLQELSSTSLHCYTFDILHGQHSRARAEYGTEDGKPFCAFGIGGGRVIKIRNVALSSLDTAIMEPYIQSLHNLTHITKYKAHPAQKYHSPYHLHNLLSIFYSHW
ncbi:hypothetical protein E3P99_02022 [Wallemia hederae]|uniref:Uncharacterized protein n=1 Tax=Wallemia hederae TaxID=1540922 RepID=A0A4T0FP14_9BASI|nr:hypothetical protein E3P99_02022 [Wallemia hederae]